MVEKPWSVSFPLRVHRNGPGGPETSPGCLMGWGCAVVGPQESPQKAWLTECLCSGGQCPRTRNNTTCSEKLVSKYVLSRARPPTYSRCLLL